MPSAPQTKPPCKSHTVQASNAPSSSRLLGALPKPKFLPAAAAAQPHACSPPSTCPRAEKIIARRRLTPDTACSGVVNRSPFLMGLQLLMHHPGAGV